MCLYSSYVETASATHDRTVVNRVNNIRLMEDFKSNLRGARSELSREVALLE